MLANLLVTVLIGIVQGITEWLPVSSTGHMILLDELVHLDVSAGFYDVFLVVIQLGSIIAVLTLFWGRLFPFWSREKASFKSVLPLWGKIIIGCIPAGVAGLLLNDIFDEYLTSFQVVAIALIVYGIAFIIIERLRAGKKCRANSLSEITYADAFFIGCFQMLALVPGTSRSGSTIIGASLLGVSRTAAAEFSFFLACPVMFGASAYKLYKFAGAGLSFTSEELVVLLVGVVVAFTVSLFAIRFLLDFVKKHSFEAFGWYRIVLGALVVAYWLIFARA